MKFVNDLLLQTLSTVSYFKETQNFHNWNRFHMAVSGSGVTYSVPHCRICYS